MDDGLTCDPCRAGHCYDCEGYCYHGCVSDEYDPDYDLNLCQPGEPARDVVTVEIPGVSQ